MLRLAAARTAARPAGLRLAAAASVAAVRCGRAGLVAARRAARPRPVAALRRALSAKAGRQARQAHRVQAAAAPFRLSERDAVDEFVEWNRSRFLSPDALTHRSGVGAVEGRFVPFFVYDVECTSRFSGRVAHLSVEPMYGSRSGATLQAVRRWQRVVPGESSARLDPLAEHDMLVYAGYAYKRPLVQALKSALPMAVPAAQMRAGPASGWKDRAFDAFYMQEGAARERVMERVHRLEVRRVREEVRRAYKASQVDVDVTVEARVRMRAVYLPAYLVDFRHAGRGYRAIVNAQTGELSAQAAYDPLRVAAAVGVPGALLAAGFALAEARAGALTPAAAVLQLATMSLAPAALAAGASQVLPALEQDRRERVRAAELERDAERLRARDERLGARRGRRRGGASAWWSGVWEFVNRGAGEAAGSGEDPSHEGERRRARDSYDRQRERYSSSYGRASGGAGQGAGRRGSPLNAASGPSHYALLRIKPNATLKEVRDAFRKLAFEMHPDMVQDPAEKAKANKRFAKVVAAYQTLRDPKKRAEYDRSIGL